jgi:hypothetical protein
VKPNCAARVGWERGTFGFVPVKCSQTVALRYYLAADGSRHPYCPKAGHRERVRQQADRGVTA